MPFTLDVTQEELELAWARTVDDRPNRRFLVHPHLVSWIETDLDSWLQRLRERLLAGYSPNSVELCLVPKPGNLLRPAALLTIEDEVVYNLLLARCFPLIEARLGGLQGEPDVAYQLSTDHDTVNWVRSGFRIWAQWRERSLEYLTPETAYVVVADVAGFYDNLDLGRLISMLRDCGCDNDVVDSLSECLNRWCYPRFKGVPQGYSASDILAKLYFSTIDEQFRADGIIHLRYVDDLRIFTGSRREARLAIRRLSELTHRHGLTLQSAKTKILDKAEARTEFDGVAPIIEDVEERLMREVGDYDEITAASVPARELLRILEQTEGPPPEVLERTFVDHFLLVEDGRFDKTLFHFLLTRLARSASEIAIDYCLETLKSRPQETEYILRYFGSVELADHQIAKLCEFVASEELIHDYQLFQLLKWFVEEQVMRGEILEVCRDVAFDHNRPEWVRCYALGYLGAYGEQPDLRRIQEEYDRVRSDLEKADVIASLVRLESSERDSFFGRVRRDNDLIERAVSVAMAGSET